MPRNSLLPIAAAAGLLCLAPQLGAADKANFSGTWKMNASKSNFGDFPAPQSIVDTIEHKDTRIKIARVMSMDQGDMKSTFDCVIGGDNCSIDTGDSPFQMKGKAKWDQDTLVLDLTGDFNGNQMKILDRLRLAADGKSINVERKFSSDMGEITQTVLMEKQ